MATWVVQIPYWLRIYEPAADPGLTATNIGGWRVTGRELPSTQPLGTASRRARHLLLSARRRVGPLPAAGRTGAEVLVPGATIGPVTGRTGLLESGT